jgi:hypothetical protein
MTCRYRPRQSAQSLFASPLSPASLHHASARPAALPFRIPHAHKCVAALYPDPRRSGFPFRTAPESGLPCQTPHPLVSNQPHLSYTDTASKDNRNEPSEMSSTGSNVRLPDILAYSPCSRSPNRRSRRSQRSLHFASFAPFCSIRTKSGQAHPFHDLDDAGR